MTKIRLVIVDKPVIKITNFVPITEDLDKIFKCDECGKTFHGSDIELKLFPNGFSAPFRMIYLVESTGAIIGSANTSNLPNDREYYTLNCPKCHMVHLFGFNVYDKRVFNVDGNEVE